MTQKQIEKWERDANRVLKRALEVEKEGLAKAGVTDEYIARRRSEIETEDDLRLFLGIL